MHVAALCEGLPANGAAVRPLAGVDTLVLGEGGKVTEAPATAITGEGLLVGVDTHVRNLARSLAERLATLVALVSALLLVQVSSNVHFQAVLVVERLAAVHALVHRLIEALLEDFGAVGKVGLPAFP